MPALRSPHSHTNSLAVPLHPVTLAVKGALVAALGTATLGLYAPATYAAEPIARPAQQTYQISAGLLGPALMEFAAQAGINLSMDPDLLKNLRTPVCRAPKPSIAALRACWKARGCMSAGWARATTHWKLHRLPRRLRRPPHLGATPPHPQTSQAHRSLPPLR